jgi:formamidopyrimidine-DNA glycosylase
VPELPEVEIAARNLRRWSAGRTIVAAEVDPAAKRIVRPSTPATLARNLAGARFALDDGGVLHYSDLRLFGRLRLVPGARFEEVPEVAALGPDPLEDGVDPARLGELLGRTRLAVKPKLLDQKLLAGVGNIYASESLFRARIDPRRPSRELSRRAVTALAGTILDAMREGIARQERPEITYVEEGGENPFLVYAREGEPCPRCGRARIQRIVQAQRSTFFCPRCQR